MTVQRATSYPPRMRRVVVPTHAQPVVDEVRRLEQSRQEADDVTKLILADRDKALLVLWDTAGKSDDKPWGLTYGQIAKITGLGESNVRRIIEMHRRP